MRRTSAAAFEESEMTSTNLVKVAFYYGIRPKNHIIDFLVQPEVSTIWEAALVDVNQRNVRDLMSMANISPAAWRAYLVERFAFDPVNPTKAGLENVGVHPDRIQFAMRMAKEMAETWTGYGTTDEAINDMWSHDTEQPANLTPAQVYEVIAETQARGTPVIVFQADEETVLKALEQDNVLTITGDISVFVGLNDPVNGYSWSPESLKGPVSFRPSCDGLVVLGEHQVFEYAVEQAYTAALSYAPGEPLILSSRDMTPRMLPPPVYRDERAPAAVASHGM
jgi:hypothetical protein